MQARGETLVERPSTCSLDPLRDGSQNAADDGGVDSIHTEMLMGHKLPGVMGKYKRRTPAKTAKSVECIHSHYRIGKLAKGGKA